jgi:hypothetical protein
MRICFFEFLIAILLVSCSVSEVKQQPWSENIQVILKNTTQLGFDNGNRLPLYLWPAIDPGNLSEDSAIILVREMDKRGLGLVCSWTTKDIDKTLPMCITIARAQKNLGQRINIDATSLLNSFFNGDEQTAHIDSEGRPFFDSSFGNHKMGCPFTLDIRKKEIRDRVEFFVNKYTMEGLSVDFIFTDWEIDGPIEVNRAFESSKKCVRCRKFLGDDCSFEKFQKTMREMRSYLQNYSYSNPVLSAFPDALIGNYAVYPNDGYRYWYDYFEYYVDGQPFKPEQKAKYRKWYNDFPATGFTIAMPVVYTWEPIFNWYNFENADYRWFYNMLLVASNAGKSTPQNIPVISFVHWNTISVSGKPDTTVKQMSKESYQELLWHMLLRGTDSFFMWSGKSEYPDEVRLLHQVYAEAQKYGHFLEHGLPITYDVPDKQGTVISGLALEDSVLIRRTDFGTNHDPVDILAGTKMISVEYNPGNCTVINMSAK